MPYRTTRLINNNSAIAPMNTAQPSPLSLQIFAADRSVRSMHASGSSVVSRFRGVTCLWTIKTGRSASSLKARLFCLMHDISRILQLHYDFCLPSPPSKKSTPFEQYHSYKSYKSCTSYNVKIFFKTCRKYISYCCIHIIQIIQSKTYMLTIPITP